MIPQNTPERRIINPYEILRGGFMPNCLMETTCVSPAAKVCYIALAWFAGKGKDTCWPSQDTLAAKYGSSRRSTYDHLKELEDHGFIRIRQNGLRQSNTYEFFSLDGWEDPLYRVAENCQSGMAETATQDGQKTATPERQNSALPIPINEPLSYEPLSSSESGVAETAASETQPPSQEGLELDSEYTSTLNPDDGEDLIGDGRRGFISNSYRRAGRPNPKLHTRANERVVQQLREAEEKYGTEQFRSELLRFLADESEDLQRAGWPLYFFLKRLERNGTGGVTRRISQPSLLDNCPGLDTSPPPTQAVSEKHQLIALWNSAVPSRAFTDPERYLVLHHEHAELMEKFETLAKKAAAIVRHTPDSTWLNLRWLCGDKEGYPNWRKLLSGSLDFKAQQARGGGKSQITVADMDEYFAEKKVKKEAEQKAKELMSDVDLSANRF